MIMYKIFFEIISDRTDADIIGTFEAVNKEVIHDYEHRYHTDKESEQDKILDNARKLLNGYTLGRYIKPIVEAVYVEE